MTPEGKLSLRPILRAHRATLVDARTGEPDGRVRATLFGLPFLAFLAMAALGVNLQQNVGELIAAVGLLAAFLFGLVVQLYERTTSWADSAPRPGPATSRYASLQLELAANAAYAATIFALAVVGLVAYDVDLGVGRFVNLDIPRRILAAVVLALLLHALLTLSMVLRRIFLVIEQRLRIARTGAERNDPVESPFTPTPSETGLSTPDTAPPRSRNRSHRSTVRA